MECFNCEIRKIPKFKISVTRLKIGQIHSNISYTLDLLILTKCGNFKKFGAFSDIASFPFLHHNFQNN